jgi:hypothetical protein
MTSIHTRCEGAFLGHAIASQYDGSNQLALHLSESIFTLKRFDGPDILSRYLYFHHTTKCDIGETARFVYHDLKGKIKSNDQSTLTRDHFLFHQLSIDETVKIADTNFNGLTAGCNPAHRSFPLALCPWIDDDDVFGFSMKEAALTHQNPLAGQVAGIVNVLCRSLLRNGNWHQAVNTAFSTPRLHQDVSDILMRYSRSAYPIKNTHAAYAPTVLNAALHYVSSSTNAKEAIEKAQDKDKFYCSPIVGLLAGVQWGVPSSMWQNGSKSSQLLHDIRETTNKMSSLWNQQTDLVFA